jgi:hypothetical protein
MQYTSLHTIINANLHICIMIRWCEMIAGIDILIVINKNTAVRDFARHKQISSRSGQNIKGSPTFRAKTTSSHSKYDQVAVVSQNPTPQWRTSIILLDVLTRKHFHTTAFGKWRPIARTRPSPFTINSTITTRTLKRNTCTCYSTSKQ